MRWTQPPSAWPRFLAAGAVISLILVAFLVYDRRLSSPNYVVKHSTPPHSSPACSNGTSAWEFHVDRDGDHHGLSEEQCRSAFPQLFTELDRTAATHQSNPIRYDEVDDLPVDDGMVRAIIQEGELYIVDFAAMPVTFSRGKATLHSLHRALSSFPDRRSLPNIEFTLTTDDYSPVAPGPPIWSYSKRPSDASTWLMPDFGFWAWPEVHLGPYADTRRRIAAIDASLPLRNKKKQLVWRGAVAPNPAVRNALLQRTHGHSWASVRPVDWPDESNFLSMEDHCRYLFVAHTEGRSFSGRSKYLLNCRSVMVAHSLEWLQPHHAALVAAGPDANYVEIERDWSDLQGKIEFLLDRPATAERIADNAVRVFRDRYLTPAAESCYWRELVRRYGGACGFEPRLAVERGTPFEMWVL